MKTKVSPAVVGAFVLGAFGLGMVALLSFGSISFLHKREKFIVYFDESTQGLTQGSPVKLIGVAVGRVVDLHVRYDAESNRSAVAVLCEFDRNTITDYQGVEIDVADPGRVQSLIDHGLRAQLGNIGLATGLLYVELDFRDPKEFPPHSSEKNSPYPVVPDIPSTTSEFQASAMEILTKFKRIDFQGLAVELQGTLRDARRQINSLDLKGLAEQWKGTGAAVTNLVNAPEIKRTFVSLDATLTDVRRTLDRLDRQVEVNGQDLGKALGQAQVTLKEFNLTALTLHRFIAAQQNLGENANHALAELTAAAEAVQRLADFLERNPNALLSGRKMPP